MKPYFLLLLVLLTCSCDNNSSSKDGYGSVKKVTPKTSTQWLKEAESDKEIYGVYELTPDSIILLRRSVGLEISGDSGKTWQWMAKNIAIINEFTVDDKGIWWGLERWAGIHEPSYCRIHRSSDRGKSWKTYVINTDVFFPYHIYSKPGKPLSIVTFAKAVHQLVGDNPLHDWKFIKQLPEEKFLADILADNYFVSNYNKLYVKRKNGVIDTLIEFKKAQDIYDIEKIKNIIYVAGPIHTTESYFATITNERKLKEFTLPGGDIKITKTQFGHIYVTSTEGAYLFKGETLEKIF